MDGTVKSGVHKSLLPTTWRMYHRSSSILLRIYNWHVLHSSDWGVDFAIVIVYQTVWFWLLLVVVIIVHSDTQIATFSFRYVGTLRVRTYFLIQGLFAEEVNFLTRSFSLRVAQYVLAKRIHVRSYSKW